MSDDSNAGSAPSPWGNVWVSMLWNVVLPVILYHYCRRTLGFGEAKALMLSACFPLLGTAFGLLRRRAADFMGAVTLASITVSLIGVALGGNPRLLLIRESLFTLLLGGAAALSLLWPGKPLMFYFGRYFTCGNDPSKIEEFTRNYEIYPTARKVHRRITQVWAVVFILEFCAKCLMVATLSTEAVLAIGPIVTNGIEIATMVWTFAYVGRQKAQAEQEPESKSGRAGSQ